MREYCAHNIKNEIFTPCNYRLTNVGFDINHADLDVKTKRTRKDYFLFLVDSGKVVIENGDKSYTVVEEGEFYIYFPNTPECFWHEGAQNAKKTFVTFMGEEIDELIEALAVKEGKITVIETSKAKELLALLLKENISKKKHYEAMSKSLLLSLLTTLARDRVSERLLPVKKARGLMMTIIDLINNNPHVSNRDLAKSLNMSADHFVRIFREFFNVTPHQYKLEIIMNTAKKYLESSTLTINQIAELLGYNNDGLYFNASFKKFVGVSPSEYRAQHCLELENSADF